MIAEHKTEDGWTLQVYSSLYLDWGLRILRPDGSELMDSPHFLSAESYGFSPAGDLTWEEAEEASPYVDAWEPWTEKEWKEALANEADELIEACGGWDEPAQVNG